ncbi:hypothetical protein ACWEIJ_21585 [Lentzea sp. NPDC004789]
MAESRISRRQSLAVLGAAVGTALVGTSLGGVASAAPAVLRNKTDPSARRYQLAVINKSDSSADMCVYQEDPDIGVADAMPLAWLSKPVGPNAALSYSWTTDYSFVWAETGLLAPGVLFKASETWPADPGVLKVATPEEAGNQIGFFQEESGEYRFASTPTKGARLGTLYFSEDGYIPPDQAAVGIGMSGSPAYAIQAQARRPLDLTLHPNYCLTAGSFQQGEVLDIGSIKNFASINFPAGGFRMTAVYQPDHTWKVYPS